MSGPRSRPTATQKVWQRRESNPGSLTTRPRIRIELVLGALKWWRHCFIMRHWIWQNAWSALWTNVEETRPYRADDVHTSAQDLPITCGTWKFSIVFTRAGYHSLIGDKLMCHNIQPYTLQIYYNTTYPSMSRSLWLPISLTFQLHSHLLSFNQHETFGDNNPVSESSRKLHCPLPSHS
jgi:hypothetical protein